MARAFLIFNPSAGRGDSARVAERVERVLSERGHEVVRRPTRGPGDATKVAREAVTCCERLVVIGGDGTLREAAEGAFGSGLELGFIPRGNANVVARELSIPLDLEGALACLTHGRARPLDAMLANGRFALAMVGIGFDACVTAWIERARRAPLTRQWYRLHADSLYAALGLAALFRPFRGRFAVRVDREERAAGQRHAVISNMSTFGKGWAISPLARPDDGLLDLMTRRRSGPFGGALLLWRAAKRRAAPAWLGQMAVGHEFEIVAEQEPFEWQADGDPLGRTTSLQVKVLPAALKLVTPLSA